MLETRNYDTELQLRALDGPAPGIISGYAAVFESYSEDMGGFREKISRYAVDNSQLNGADIRVLADHDTARVLGRTRSGTAKVGADTQGIYFEAQLPDTSYARDLWASMERGDISQASFGFYVAAEDWSEDEAHRPVRTITQIERIVEVSVVAVPAYPDTGVAIKRCAVWQQGRMERAAKLAAESRRRTLALLKLGVG